MPQYCFVCRSQGHPETQPRQYVAFVHLTKEQLKKNRTIDQYPCPYCGDYGVRDLGGEIPSQNIVGVTPMSESTTVKGSLYHTAKFAFGDGTGQAPFRDIGEFNRFLNGHNNLGPPEVDDTGNPIRQKNGTFLRRGEKFVQMPRGATPKRSAPMPRHDLPDAFCDSSELPGIDVVSSGGSRATSVAGVHHQVPRYQGPRRLPRKK